MNCVVQTVYDVCVWVGNFDFFLIEFFSAKEEIHLYLNVKSLNTNYRVVLTIVLFPGAQFVLVNH